jgi:hypothetical protein
VSVPLLSFKGGDWREWMREDFGLEREDLTCEQDIELHLS